jgi:hypothetical protein
MWTTCAVVFAAFDGLLTQLDVGTGIDGDDSGTLQMCCRENQQSSEFVLIEVPNRVDEIPI